MKEFTFGIISYNSELFVIETLESVKYQIMEFGAEIDVYLVISDDNSTDNTLFLINKWIEVNKSIFKDWKVLTNQTGRGCARNFVNLLNNIRTEHFVAKAADDIFASGNIFDKIARTNDDEISVFMPVRFRNGQAYYGEYDLENMYYYAHSKHSNRIDLRTVESIKPFISPETCVRRKYYDDACITYLGRYIQFEDDPSLYSIMKNHSEVKLNFYLAPLVLYRINDKGLSNGEISSHQIQFIDDLYYFKKDCLKREKNIFMKVFQAVIVWAAFLQRHRFSIEKSFFAKLVKGLQRRRAKLARASEGFLEYKTHAEKMLTIEKEHLEIIGQRACEFMEMKEPSH